MRFAAAVLVASLLLGSPGHAEDVAAARAPTRFAVAFEDPGKTVPMNVMINRVVLVTALDGRPVENAIIRVEGGMKTIARDLPTAPQVTGYLGEGRYLIEGLKFNMRGAWELSLHIDAAGQSDRTSVSLVVE